MSILFYALLTIDYLPLLLISITFNYGIARLIIGKWSVDDERSNKNFVSNIRNQITFTFSLISKNHRKEVFFCGIVGDLCLLAYYKYFNFVIANLDALGLTIPQQDIILPLGISFFTFTQLAFLADSYNDKVERMSFISYLQFVSFFPHLIAGPIYHHAEIISQFEDSKGYSINWSNINLGVFFFFFGLAKKVIIADSLSLIVGPIFSFVSTGGTPMALEAWIGALAYTLQLYFDFSGYSDMAVGIALMFNIHFPMNFYSPYKVTSIIDFWRCWHITLSNWLRDYLYIPLGGNRYGVPNQIRNILITMLLGGLWHGAGWTFIIWGGVHGVYLIFNHIWRRTGIRLHASICWLVTFVAVVVGWVIFRSDSIESAMILLKGMSGCYGVNLPTWMPDTGYFLNFNFIALSPVESIFAIGIVCISLAISLCLPNLVEMTRHQYGPIIHPSQKKIRLIKPINFPLIYTPSVRWSIITGFIAVCAIISLQTTSEFLYFQF